MTNPLSPAAQAIHDAFWSHPNGKPLVQDCPDTDQLVAALRAAADQVVPVRAWHESDNDAAWERHQMSVIINRRILSIAAELEALP